MFLRLLYDLQNGEGTSQNLGIKIFIQSPFDKNYKPLAHESKLIKLNFDMKARTAKLSLRNVRSLFLIFSSFYEMCQVLCKMDIHCCFTQKVKKKKKCCKLNHQS